MSDKLFIRRDTSRRGGFTLIEVAIALAIFVFGALAIIRIFPPALGVIQNSGDQLTAVSFNRSTLARFARQPELVPDALYDTNPANGWRDNLVGSVAGTPRRNNSLPLGTIQNVDLEYNQSALGHFRNIVRERHTATANGVVLTQYPFENNTATGVAPIIFQEDEVTGVRMRILADGTLDGSLDFSESRLASTNAVFSTTVAPPDTHSYDPAAPGTVGNTTFYVSYRWLEDLIPLTPPDDPRISATTDEPIVYTIDPTDDPNPKTVQGQRRTAGTAITLVEGEVSVRFRRVIPSPTGPDINGDVGRLVLAPNQRVSIDYRVRDWRWMVYDGVPTVQPENGTATQRAINLPVRSLDETKTPFAFTLFPSQNPTVPPENSTTLESDPPEPNPPTPSDRMKRKTGQIIFDLSTIPVTTPPTAPNARAVYWTLDNWAQQLSVAASNYKLSYTTASSNPPEPWRDCVLNLSGTILYFKPSEAGKTVLVTYSYREAGAAEDTQIDGRILTINDDLISLPGSSFAVGGRVSRLELTAINGLPLTTPVTSIRRIQGVSIEARTAWLDGNRFSQASTVGYRGAHTQ